MVGILDHVPCLLRTAGTQVDAIHGGDIGLAAPVAKFMQAHFVGLCGRPGKIQSLGAVGAHGVLPVKAGYKVAAGVTHGGHAQVAHLLQHILPETLGVRGGVAGLIDAAIYGAAHVLDEGTIDAGINLTDGVCLVQGNACVHHCAGPPCKSCDYAMRVCDDG